MDIEAIRDALARLDEPYEEKLKLRQIGFHSEED